MCVCVNNTSVLCVCASFADAQWFIIHQPKTDLKITSMFTGCIHTCFLVKVNFVYMCCITVTLGFSWFCKCKTHRDDAIRVGLFLVAQRDTRVWLNLLQTQVKSGGDVSASLKPPHHTCKYVLKHLHFDFLKSVSFPLSLQCFCHKTVDLLSERAWELHTIRKTVTYGTDAPHEYIDGIFCWFTADHRIYHPLPTPAFVRSILDSMHGWASCAQKQALRISMTACVNR